MTVDDRQARLLLRVAVALVVLGAGAFLLRGADEPTDPALGEPVPTSSTAPGAADAGGTDAAATDSAPPPREPLPGFSEVAITVETTDGRGLLAWCLLAARTAEQRSRGLMEVTDLGPYPGMAFLYDEPVTNAFYMRNTPMPLSIAWIDGDGAIVSTADMAPCEDRDGCPTYAPDGSYRVAIEVPQGRLDELGIAEGARVTLGEACPPA